MPTILTSGVFDLGMHAGHFQFLQQCRTLAGPDGSVIVALNSDYSAENYKRRPVFDKFEREYYMQQCGLVDLVIIVNSEEDIIQIIKEKKVDYYAKGDEWATQSVTGEDLCQVIFFRGVKSYYSGKLSTSQIIKRVNDYNRASQADNS